MFLVKFRLFTGGVNMIKKFAKIVLLTAMVLAAVISVTNFTGTNLQSQGLEGFRVTTWYEDIPDCYGPAKDCNDFTAPPPT